MNIFEYLKEDEAYIERRLKALTVHCPEWTQEKVFDESVKVFAAVTVHLEKKETLLTAYLSYLDDELKNTIETSTQQRFDIEAVIDGLTQMHVDEPEYQSTLEGLLRKVLNHRKFCQEWLYPQIETHLSKSEKDLINHKLEELVYS